MRRAAKVDANQSAVVKALRDAGCEVECLHAVGGGVPDLLVGRIATTRHDLVGGGHYQECRHYVYLLEVKDGAKKPSARKLTPEQVEWHRRWPVSVVTSPEEALRAVGLLQSEATR